MKVHIICIEPEEYEDMTIDSVWTDYQQVMERVENLRSDWLARERNRYAEFPEDEEKLTEQAAYKFYCVDKETDTVY